MKLPASLARLLQDAGWQRSFVGVNRSVLAKNLEAVTLDSRIEPIVSECRCGKINRRVFFERLIAVLGTYPLAHHFLLQGAEKSGRAGFR